MKISYEFVTGEISEIEGKTNEESREVQTETLVIKARPLASGYAKAKTGNKTSPQKFEPPKGKIKRYGCIA